MLGLALGLAMPVAAGVPSDATAAAPTKQALPSEAAKTDGVIVVAGKDKNWNKSKNWNNKHWNNKKVVVVGPLPEVEQAGLLWHRGRWRGAWSDLGRGRIFGCTTGAEYLLVLGRPGADARLLELLLTARELSACSSTDRAPDFEFGGWGFEPLQARHFLIGRISKRLSRRARVFNISAALYPSASGRCCILPQLNSSLRQRIQ